MFPDCREQAKFQMYDTVSAMLRLRSQVKDSSRLPFVSKGREGEVDTLTESAAVLVGMLVDVVVGARQV